MSRVDVSMIVNGETVSASVEPRTHLADFLREERLLTGTHVGCEQGVCGACTLMVDGRAVRSCITYAVACDGRNIQTVEGYDDDPLMAQIRDAFTRHHGLQCGFCTPGMLATAYDIVRRIPDADEAQIRKELSGNLCRCTGYAGIVSAIVDVLRNGPPAAPLKPLPRKARTVGLGAAPSAKTTHIETRASQAGTTKPADTFDLDAPVEGETLMRKLDVDAPADQVWSILRDIPSVVACIPGASLDGPPVGDTFNGKCVVALGPMKARFQGSGAMRKDDAKHTGRVVGKGRDGLTRTTVDGALDFGVSANGENRSIVAMEMTYRLQGTLAQFGRKALIEEIADRILQDVATRLTARATGQSSAATEPEASLNGLAIAFGAIMGLIRRIFRR